MDALAHVEQGRVVISECVSTRFCNQLRSAGALRGDNEVNVLEAAYQLVRGRLGVRGYEQGWLGGLRLISDLIGDIDYFIVYYDLRRRGRRVRQGVRPRTLIVSRGGARDYEVLVLSEGTPTSFGYLSEWSRLSVRDGFTPVVAIVDGYGIVAYYEARSVSTLV